MRVGAVCGSVAMLAALLAWTSPAPGGELAPRVIDQALRCSTLTDATGRRSVTITVAPRAPQSKTQLTVFTSGRTVEHTRPFVDVLAPGPRFPKEEHGLWITGLCKTVKPTFRISPAGLTGTAAQGYAAERCEAGRTVLLRLRVEFTPWRGWIRHAPVDDRDRGWRYPSVRRGLGKPKTVSLVVRSGGRPIAYATFDARGGVRLVTAGRPRCVLGR
jgi:hypothetical protein